MPNRNANGGFDAVPVETDWNKTVIRLIQLGKPVKSMLVPLVDACAVPDVITLDAIALTTAPDIVGPDNVAPVNGLDNPVLSIVDIGMVYVYSHIRIMPCAPLPPPELPEFAPPPCPPPP